MPGSISSKSLLFSVVLLTLGVAGVVADLTHPHGAYPDIDMAASSSSSSSAQCGAAHPATGEVLCQGSAPQRVMRTVVVVGGGLAGMAAAVEAESHGARVVLLDKEPLVGGNSAKASSGMNAVLTPAQLAAGVADTMSAFRTDTLASGGGRCEDPLVETLVALSTDAHAFLTSLGVNLGELSQCGGHSFARTHRAQKDPSHKGPARNIGWTITNAVRAFLDALPAGRVVMRTGSTATRLLTNTQGAVVGVQYTDAANTTHTVDADAVVLATGGFGASDEMLQQYAPAVARLPTTNGAFAQGQGIQLAKQVSAALTLMDAVQVHPTGLVDPKQPDAKVKFLGAEALRGVGGLLLSRRGRRFVNELGLRSEVTNAIFSTNDAPVDPRSDAPLPPTTAFLVLSDEAVEAFDPKAFGFYKMKGLATRYPTVADFAAAAHLDTDVVRDELARYHAAATANAPDAFGRSSRLHPPSATGALNVALITPAIHYTMGGVRIDTSARVLSAATLAPIPGLYAAGEVTGGVHGANRLAGNSLLECVVYGRLAGAGAAGPHQPHYQAAMVELAKTFGGRFTSRPAERLRVGRDASPLRPIVPDAVVVVESVEDVQAVVRIAAAHVVPVVAWGFGSSLEGHVHAVRGGITIDFSRMKKVLSVDKDNMLVTVQPGLRQNELNDFLKEFRLMFPIDPGASPSLGGMVGTRASGTTAIGYGTMRDNVRSLQVVSSDARVFRTATLSKKSSSGYDLTRLYTGMEGTLGIITEITLHVYPIPESVGAATCAFPSVIAAARTVIESLQGGAHPARMELLNTEAIQAVNNKFSLAYAEQPTLFMEFHGPTGDNVAEQMRGVRAVAERNGGTMWTDTMSEEQRNLLWKARHGAYFAASQVRPPPTKLFVTDTCVPLSRLADCISATEADFAASFLPGSIVGHVGDGNFHVMSAFNDQNDTEVAEIERLNERLVRRALEMGGTCSGEHGVGLGKRQWLMEEHGPVAVDIMRRIKTALDPLNILNPDKLLPTPQAGGSD